MYRVFRWVNTGCLTALATAAASFCLVSPAAASGPDLEVEGNRIRDLATARDFIPRGVNWPSFEYACVQGWGYSNSGADAATARAMRDWRINTVRIPLNEDCWLGDDGQPAGSWTAAGYRNAVERFVNTLTSSGLAVILDLHWTAPLGTVANGLRPMPDHRSDDFWASVAGRFKSNRSVIFDLFNEPHSRWNNSLGIWAFLQSWTCWTLGGCLAPNQADTDGFLSGLVYPTLGMNSLVSAVRSTGATQPIILSGLDYANDLSEWEERAPDDDQLIAGFHNYPGQRCSDAACWNGEVGTLAAAHPVVAAEFGQRDCGTGHLEDFMNWADTQRIGYLAWAWWVLPDEGCSNFALIDNLSGKPSKPYGVAFRDHLVRIGGAGGQSPPPGPPPPIVRKKPNLKIVALRFRRRVVKARVRVRPEATNWISARIEFFRAGKRHRIWQRIKVYDGLGILRKKLPRRSKPVRLFVRYRGDRMLLPQKTSRILKGR